MICLEMITPQTFLLLDFYLYPLKLSNIKIEVDLLFQEFGGDPVTAEVVNDKGDHVNTKLKDNGDGTYHVNFTPNCSGTYCLKVSNLHNAVLSYTGKVLEEKVFQSLENFEYSIKQQLVIHNFLKKLKKSLESILRLKAIEMILLFL